MKMLRAVATCLALGVLAGCDRPSHDNPLFPLAKGKSWTYQIETVYDDPDGKTVLHTFEMRNLGSAELGDGSTAWIRRSNNGHEYWLVSNDQGISRVAMKTPTQEQAVMDIQPRQVLPAKLAVGQTWTYLTAPYFLKRRNEQPAEIHHLNRYKNLPMVFKVAELDVKIQTPAGDFEHCAKVEGVMEILIWNDHFTSFKPTPILTREWYCPDVGLVQVERDEPTTAKFFQGGRMRMRLLDYH